jgi:hypothetical protein
MTAGDGSNLPPVPEDLGEPVTELKGLVLDASPRFLAGVRSKIDRKRTAGQLIGFGWEIPRVILLEFAGWAQFVQELLGAKGRR